MAETRNLRCYEYVNAPYDAVRNLFRDHPRDILVRATASAATRSNAVRARPSRTRVRRRRRRGGHSPPGARNTGRGRRRGDVPGDEVIAVAWEAEHGKPFFPIMNATVSFWPLSSTETQLEIEGAYRPPLGFVGRQRRGRGHWSSCRRSSRTQISQGDRRAAPHGALRARNFDVSAQTRARRAPGPIDAAMGRRRQRHAPEGPISPPSRARSFNSRGTCTSTSARSSRRSSGSRRSITRLTPSLWPT